MNNIDDFMREQFEKQQYPFVEQHWEKAKILLEQNEKKRKKRYFLGFFLVVSLVGALGLGGYATFGDQNATVASVQTQSITQSNNVEVANTSGATSNITNNNTDKTINAATDASSLDITSNSTNTKKPASNEKQSASQNNDLKNSNTSKDAKRTDTNQSATGLSGARLSGSGLSGSGLSGSGLSGSGLNVAPKTYAQPQINQDQVNAEGKNDVNVNPNTFQASQTSGTADAGLPDSSLGISNSSFVVDGVKRNPQSLLEVFGPLSQISAKPILFDAAGLAIPMKAQPSYKSKNTFTFGAYRMVNSLNNDVTHIELLGRYNHRLYKNLFAQAGAQVTASSLEKLGGMTRYQKAYGFGSGTETWYMAPQRMFQVGVNLGLAYQVQRFQLSMGAELNRLAMITAELSHYDHDNKLTDAQRGQLDVPGLQYWNMPVFGELQYKLSRHSAIAARAAWQQQSAGLSIVPDGLNLGLGLQFSW